MARLTDPAGGTRIASHLTVDGAFNINSTEAVLTAVGRARLEAAAVIGNQQPEFGHFISHPEGYSRRFRVFYNVLKRFADGKNQVMASLGVNGDSGPFKGKSSRQAISKGVR